MKRPTRNHRAAVLNHEPSLLGTPQASEEFFRLLFDEGPIGMAIVGPDLHFVRVNTSFVQMTGYTDEELRGLTFPHITHPAHRDVDVTNATLLMNRVISKYHTEKRYIKKNGDIVWASTTISAVRDRAGKFLYFLAVVEDITGLRRAAIELSGAQQMLRNVIENFPGVVFWKDRNSVYQGCNRAFARGAGLESSSEIVGKTDLDLPWAKTEADAYRADDRAVMESRLPKLNIIETQLQADGRIVWFDTSKVPLFDDQGEVIGVVGVSNDITERRRAEESMIASEFKYRRLHETMMDAFVSVDMGGRIREFNETFSRMLGYVPEELSGLSYADITPQKWHALEASITDTQVLTRGFSDIYEKEYRRKDGSVLPVELRTILIRDSLGKPSGMWAVIRDITTRKRAEAALKESLEKVQRSLNGIIQSITMLVEIKDPYTAGHQKRVSLLAAAIARELGLSDERVSGLTIAAVLHDIGKIYVPSEILSKPGSLSPLELEVVKVHSRASYDILKNIDFPWPVADIAFQHQERYDGSGYPQGLRGDEILFEARILAVADVVEAMTLSRPYRSAKGVESALEEIVRNKGVLYDPDAVEACLRLFREKRFTFQADAGR